VVGTGSSRKSATNSVLWFTGEDIPFVPNKRFGGVCLGSKIAPIFFNTMEDAGALPIEIDVSQMDMGDEIELKIDAATTKVTALKNGAVIAESQLKTPVILDEVRAGGRIPLIIGRGLTTKAREALGLPPRRCSACRKTRPIRQGLLAGAEDGRPRLWPAEGKGIRPGTYCEPKMTTVGSQDTTGPMTRDELKDLACLGFSADLVMQSFCHTAAYPKLVDVKMHRDPAELHHHPRRRLAASGRRRHPLLAQPPAAAGYRRHRRRLAHPLPDRHLLPGRFRPGRLCRRHRRHAAGHAGIGAGALQGHKMQPGITLRDLVNAIPYYAIKQGLLTVEKKGKKNIFSGRILEIEGLPDLKVEQAFELSDASAERSAAACAVRPEQGTDHRVHALEHHADEVDDRQRLSGCPHPGRRIKAMEAWIANPQLLKADADAEYAAVIEIDLADVKEPIVACPNDPDDVKLLSEVAGAKIDEVFIGSCMTNIGHFRAAGKVLDGKSDIPTRLWIAPPTKMDAMILNEEGYYASSASPARAWKCRAARCAWATRRRSARAARRCRPRRATSRTAWASTPASTSVRPNWPRSAR
jgi:aconitate hydratase 2/2-methylisocitrate dehydratase